MPRTRPSPIRWDDLPQPFGADPACTIALDSDGWRQLGASFTEVEDDLHGVARRATGVVHDAAGSFRFAVLDHAEPTTFLMVPPDGDEALSHVLAALLRTGVPATAVRERLPAPAPPSLQERIADLETALAGWVFPHTH
jgi:hypothetical protein